VLRTSTNTPFIYLSNAYFDERSVKLQLFRGIAFERHVLAPATKKDHQTPGLSIHGPEVVSREIDLADWLEEEEFLKDRRGGVAGCLAAREAEATAMLRGSGMRIFNFAFGPGRGVLLLSSASGSGVNSESTDKGELGIALRNSSGVVLSIFTEGCDWREQFSLRIGYPSLQATYRGRHTLAWFSGDLCPITVRKSW
jgi:hypothetical protein